MAKRFYFVFFSFILLSITVVFACQDFDQGKEYYNDSYVIVNKEKHFDSCSDAEHLVEYYCENNQIKEETYKCSAGCLFGRCLIETKEDEKEKDKVETVKEPEEKETEEEVKPLEQPVKEEETVEEPPNKPSEKLSLFQRIIRLFKRLFS